MTADRREPPLRLDMSFEEALSRFSQADAAELPDSIKLGKKAGGRHSPAAKVERTNAGGKSRKHKPRPPLPTG